MALFYGLCFTSCSCHSFSSFYMFMSSCLYFSGSDLPFLQLLVFTNVIPSSEMNYHLQIFPKPPKHLSTSYWGIIRTLEVPFYPFHTRPSFYRYSNSVISKSCWWSEMPANFSKNMDSQAAAQINWIIITKCLVQEFIFFSKASLAVKSD